MSAMYSLLPCHKRKAELTNPEDDIFHLFNGDPHKKRHAEAEECFNICNKSLEYLPSFNADREEQSVNQQGPNDIGYNDYFAFSNANKINYKIEEFLEIGSEQTAEDSFYKDFPKTQESFSDIFVFWEYEEDDLMLVREIFCFNDWLQKESKSGFTIRNLQFPGMGFAQPLESVKKAEFKSPWVEKVGLQISDIELRYFLMGQLFKMFSDENPYMKIT